MSARPTERDALIDISMQLLCVLIDYRPPPAYQMQQLAEVNAAFRAIVSSLRDAWKELMTPEVLGKNEFYSLLGSIEEEANYKVLFTGLGQLLANYVAMSNSALPSAVRKLGFYRELSIFVLRLVGANPVHRFEKCRASLPM